MFIGEGSLISAAVINSYVYIGKNVVIVSAEIDYGTMINLWLTLLTELFQGRRCILKDCCMIEDGAIVPPETVVPTFTRYGGNPATKVGELPECSQDIMVDFTKSYYRNFTPVKEYQ